MKRRALMGAGLGVILVTVAAVFSQAPPTDPPSSPGAGASSFEMGIPTAQEVRNMLAVYGERVEATEKELQSLREELKTSREEVRLRHQEGISGLERMLRELQGRPVPEPPPKPSSPRFRTFEFETGSGRSLHVPAGSFGEATLLTGVFAPTSGEPMPVLLKLESALIGPQRSRVPLNGAFLVGKAQGDTNSRRAVVQLESLSAVSPEGIPHEVRVNGWIVDHDGVQGLKGRYVWRAEEIVALSSLTGALSGGAEAMAQRETVSQVTPLGGVQGSVKGDPVRFAGYRALSSAMGRLGDTLTHRLDEIVPAVYVPNGRQVTVAFIAGVTIEGYEAAPEPASPYEGLDR